MYLPLGTDITKDGRLTVAGKDASALARKYGTPLYVINEDTVLNTCRTFVDAMKKYFGGSGKVLFASKAFCNIYMHRLVTGAGLGLDVVSGGELYTAIKAGVDLENVYFHGNNKTVDELTMAVNADIGRIVVDNAEEMVLLNTIASAAGKKVKVLFRLKPGIDAHTHDFVKTGRIDSKFGFAIENGEAFEAISGIAKYPSLQYTGIHCHIGSQIFDEEPFGEAVDVMLKFAKKLKDEAGLKTAELNLGGGYGITYTDEDDPCPFDGCIKRIHSAVNEVCAREGLDMPFILIEPGRSIVGEAGLTLYTVGSVKRIKNIKNYVSVDGGMTDNPRYALYGSKYSVVLAEKAASPADEVFTVAGKCCESGDIVAADVKLAPPDAGDILAVFSTGAYNYSMASNYNRNLKPAVLVVSEKDEKIVVKRETLDDIIKNDVL